MVTLGNAPDCPVEMAHCRFFSVSSWGSNNRPRNKGMEVGVGLVFVFCFSDNFDIIVVANSSITYVVCGEVSELSGVHR